MTFNEVLAQVLQQLQREGRVSYRALQRQYALDDDYLEDLKAEIIDAKRLATDEDGKVLVWTGASLVSGSTFQVSSSQPPAPLSYTPSHLAERILATQAAMAARGATDGERKIVTLVFSDLKGSTALIEGLDPEDARAIIDPALHIMMDAVHRYEGYVAQALGDGIFALFGAPLAHEDHPQRALYAALRMQEEMRRYSDTLRERGRAPLLMRVGVNTGEVVVRSIRKEDLHTDYVPIGHSTNVAARMEQLAAPGSILVTEQTHKLTAGYFEFKALGKTQVKGVEAPLNVYEVIGAGPLRTRLQVSVRRGLTRFVGRLSEMDQLRKALEQAKAGHGQIVGVMGEPGVGKSRLFYEFKLTSQSGCLVLEAFSVSHGKASPYLPVIELLKTYFDITVEDDERKRREKVGGKVLMLDRSLEDTLPYLFSLLGIEDSTSSLQQMDPQIRRRRTFEALKRLFLRESLNQPLILIFEDLHWIDSETQGLLDVLSESVASARILLLTNYRPEYRHEWGSKTYYTQLRLAPLGKDEAEELLTFLLGNDINLKALKQLILEKTEGTPFFMEEVVQTLAEEGILTGERGNYRLTHHVPTLHVPTTVQGVLTARIDRLAPAEKAFLHQLAIIGRQFPLSLVRRVVPQPEEELYRLLSSLQSKEFLYEQPAFPEPEYLFKHALTQEVAYGTVLQDRRKALHERTAQAIENLYSAKLEDHYSELAHHYSRSGNTQKAVEYLGLTGQQAVQRWANTEAITHLTTALELLKTLPDTPERAQHELTLQIALGTALMATKGYAALEAGRAYARARELCQQVGDSLQLFPVLRGLLHFHLNRGELQSARELGEQLLSLAQGRQDSAFLLEAHYTLALLLFYLGEIVSARQHAEQGIALYDLRQHRFLTFRSGESPGMACLLVATLALWWLGYPEQALQRNREALALAQELAHPFSLAWALMSTVWLHQCRREVQSAQEVAEATLTLASEHGFQVYLAFGALLGGWTLAEEGQTEEGITQMRQGLANLRAMGQEAVLTYPLALLAETYAQVGQTEKGLQVVAEALTIMDRNGERFYEAELYRLKGTLTLQSRASLGQVSDKSKASHEQVQDKSQTSLEQVRTSQDQSEDTNPQSPTPNPQAEAEECFLKALEIARRQSAKSLELRATMSLARLWQQQGKHHAARTTLSAIYSWFTEGFDTKDLQEAKALLDDLS
jgi:predicted ATPase/class 3 adenylate cyclase